MSIAGPAAASAAEKLSFALNWVPGPQHMEFVAAQKQGFFEKNGLDVSMHPPASSTDPIKLVASGNDQFGIAYGGDVIQARAQGVPIVSVAVIHRKIPLGLLSSASSNIKEPKDLEGKTIGLTPVPNNRAMFWDFVKRTGINKDSIQVVTVQFNGPQVVAAKKADAADAVSFYELGVYKQVTGEAPSYMPFTDYGVPDGYFFTIITSEAYLKSNPETVRAFVDSILQAEKWTVTNPDEARKLLLANVPDVSDEFARQSRAAIDPMVVDADTDTHGIGWNSPQTWQAMADWYAEQGLIPAKIDAAAAYSNEFLPKEPVKIDR
jgi:putative hydroxymethylpyrimidine transport system substrate-binding protein